MWIVNFLLILFIVGLPLIGVWLWRLGKALNGVRLENHHLQVQRFFRQMGFIWLLMVLILGHNVLDLYPGSRIHRAFWSGVFIASDSFLLAFAIYNFVCHLGQLRDKRQHRI